MEARTDIIKLKSKTRSEIWQRLVSICFLTYFSTRPRLNM